MNDIHKLARFTIPILSTAEHLLLKSKENRFLIKIQTTTKYYFRFIENIKHGKKFSLRQQLRNWSH